MSEKKEYIERVALMKFAKENIGGVIYQRDIDRFPAADVEPVARGEWIEMRDPYGDLTGWIHEECGHETQCASNYCSKCGAKMKFIERSGSCE